MDETKDRSNVIPLRPNLGASDIPPHLSVLELEAENERLMRLVEVQQWHIEQLQTVNGRALWRSFVIGAGFMATVWWAWSWLL